MLQTVNNLIGFYASIEQLTVIRVHPDANFLYEDLENPKRTQRQEMVSLHRSHILAKYFQI